MAYQNVGTPRFYVSILQWLNSLGKLNGSESSPQLLKKSVLDLTNINPTSQATFDGGGGDYVMNFISTAGNYKTLMPNDKNFFMVLGHEFGGNAIQFVTRTGANDHNWVANSGLVNYSNTVGYTADYDGFSISRGNDAHDDGDWNNLQLLFATYTAGVVFKFGSVLYGTYFDLPHSPDLNLTMSREMDGVKRIRTKGGADLVGHKYTKSPTWGILPAWELSTLGGGAAWQTNVAVEAVARSGRRVWDLSFSYLQDSDIFPDVSSLTNYETDGYSSPGGGGGGGGAGEEWETWDNVTSNTLLNEDTFYSQVIHKTNGGQLPFIFQPDVNDNTNFAIAKFASGFKFDQVANGVYNVKLKIREVW